jgi:hypothetical protein
MFFLRLNSFLTGGVGSRESHLRIFLHNFGCNGLLFTEEASVQHIHHQLNHLAILASAVILWVLGALWYSPALFAKPWMALLGFSKEGHPNKKGLVPAMMASFVCDLVLAFVFDHLIIWSGAATFGWGALVGFIAWVGFFAAPNLPQGMYENRPFKLFAINNGYWLVGLLIIGGVLGAWR